MPSWESTSGDSFSPKRRSLAKLRSLLHQRIAQRDEVVSRRAKSMAQDNGEIRHRLTLLEDAAAKRADGGRQLHVGSKANASQKRTSNARRSGLPRSTSSTLPQLRVLPIAGYSAYS